METLTGPALNPSNGTRSLFTVYYFLAVLGCTLYARSTEYPQKSGMSLFWLLVLNWKSQPNEVLEYVT